MSLIDQPHVPDGKHMCPSCREPVEVLSDGRLAWHYGLPGCGQSCPEFDTTERLR